MTQIPSQGGEGRSGFSVSLTETASMCFGRNRNREVTLSGYVFRENDWGCLFSLVGDRNHWRFVLRLKEEGDIGSRHYCILR